MSCAECFHSVQVISRLYEHLQLGLVDAPKS